jgi:hypothetical protein
MSKHANSKSNAIRTYLLSNPKASTDEVVKALKEQGMTDIKREHVYSLRSYDRLRVKRLRNKRAEATKAVLDWKNLKAGDVVGGMVLTKTKDDMYRWVKDSPKPVDNINSPAHYTAGGIETIDFIKAKLTPEEFRGYLKGNVLKYASRAGLKGNAVEDAGKLAWYATRLAKEA